MCGIVGGVTNSNITPLLIEGLNRLEYRGYDSAGLATLSDGIINEVKSEGRVESLEKNSIDLYSSLKSIYLQDRENKIKNSVENKDEWGNLDN